MYVNDHITNSILALTDQTSAQLAQGLPTKEKQKTAPKTLKLISESGSRINNSIWYFFPGSDSQSSDMAIP